MLEALSAIAGIVLVDLTLSGDNALVIGAAASGLPVKQRRMAILLGGGGAIVLRILFAILATLLLRLPLLQAAGGLLLLVIAARLLAGRNEHEPADEGAVQQSGSQRGLIGALVTITLADVTMSLDNILAIGALAAGHIPLLVVGLLLSIALVLAGSALVAALIRRLPWLLDLAALVLGWTAAGMLLEDARVGPLLHALPGGQVLVYAAALLVVLAVDVVLRLRARRDRNGEGAGGNKGQHEGMSDRRDPDHEIDTVPHAHE